MGGHEDEKKTVIAVEIQYTSSDTLMFVLIRGRDIPPLIDRAWDPLREKEI